MKLARSLVAFLVLSLPLAGTTLAPPVQAAPASSSDALAPLPFWLVELMTDQIARGGWSCACTPASEGTTILGRYKFDDEVEHGDRHDYQLINKSDYEIPVILTLTDSVTGDSRGRFELTLAPQSSRKISTTYWLPEETNSEIIRTIVKATIPENAVDTTHNDDFGDIDMSDAESQPLVITRTHFYAQPNRPKQLLTGDLNCDSSGCADHGPGGIGNCAGPSFHRCF